MKKKLLLFGALVIVGVTLILNANPKIAYAAEEQESDCNEPVACEYRHNSHYRTYHLVGIVICCGRQTDTDRGCKGSFIIDIPPS